MIENILYNLYRIKNSKIRWLIRKIICRLENGEMYSSTLRRIFKYYYDVEIGMYSYGGCFIPNKVDRFTTIGRYCSMAGNIPSLYSLGGSSFPSSNALTYSQGSFF